MNLTGAPLVSYNFLVTWKMFSPCRSLKEASWQEKEKYVGFVRQPAFFFLNFLCSRSALWQLYCPIRNSFSHNSPILFF